jgi:hypothetical protein
MKKTVLLLWLFAVNLFADAIPESTFTCEVSDTSENNRFDWDIIRGEGRYLRVVYTQYTTNMNLGSLTNVYLYLKASNSTNRYSITGAVQVAASGSVRVLWATSNAVPVAVYWAEFGVPENSDVNLAARGKINVFEGTGTAIPTNPPWASVETDPVFNSTPAAWIKAVDTQRWNTVSSGGVQTWTAGPGMTNSGSANNVTGGLNAASVASLANADIAVTNISTHQGLTGTNVHGLGSASTNKSTDFYLATNPSNYVNQTVTNGILASAKSYTDSATQNLVGASITNNVLPLDGSKAMTGNLDHGTNSALFSTNTPSKIKWGTQAGISYTNRYRREGLLIRPNNVAGAHDLFLYSTSEGMFLSANGINNEMFLHGSNWVSMSVGDIESGAGTWPAVMLDNPNNQLMLYTSTNSDGKIMFGANGFDVGYIYPRSGIWDFLGKTVSNMWVQVPNTYSNAAQYGQMTNMFTVVSNALRNASNATNWPVQFTGIYSNDITGSNNILVANGNCQILVVTNACTNYLPTRVSTAFESMYIGFAISSKTFSINTNNVAIGTNYVGQGTWPVFRTNGVQGVLFIGNYGLTTWRGYTL